MSLSTVFNLKQSLDSFMLPYPEMNPRVVLHTSCVLDPLESLENVLTNSRIEPYLPRDVYYELLLLSKKSGIPAIKKNADTIITKFEQPNPYHALEGRTDMEYFTDLHQAADFFAPTASRPLVFCFYSASDAEEFVRSLKASKEEPPEHIYLIFIDPLHSDTPNADAWMFPYPTPIETFLSLWDEFLYKMNQNESVPHIFRKLGAFDTSPGGGNKFGIDEAESFRSAEIEYTLEPLHPNYMQELTERFGQELRFSGKQLISIISFKGGEGAVFTVSGKGANYALKRYWQTGNEKTVNIRDAKLRQLGAYAPLFRRRAAFPIALVKDSGRTVGFLMDLCKDLGQSSDSKNPSSNISRTLKKNLTERPYQPLNGKREPFFRVLIDVTVLLLEMRLFQLNIVDLHYDNILTTMSLLPELKLGNTQLVDCDSIETDTYSNALRLPFFAHPDNDTSRPEWFRLREFIDFSYAVLLGCILTHREYFLGLGEPTGWTRESFNADSERIFKRVIDTTGDKYKALFNQYTAFPHRTVGFWVDVFQDDFFPDDSKRR